MAFKMKGNPFKKHDGGKEHPFGWTDQEYDRAKKEKIAQYKQLRKLNPKDSTLEWQEFGKDKERYFTNKQKADDLQKYIKKTFKIDLP